MKSSLPKFGGGPAILGHHAKISLHYDYTLRVNTSCTSEHGGNLAGKSILILLIFFLVSNNDYLYFFPLTTKIQCSMSPLKYSTEVERLLLAKGVGDKITHGG
jgi:hypothetical protein